MLKNLAALYDKTQVEARLTEAYACYKSRICKLSTYIGGD